MNNLEKSFEELSVGSENFPIPVVYDLIANLTFSRLIENPQNWAQFKNMDFARVEKEHSVELQNLRDYINQFVSENMHSDRSSSDLLDNFLERLRLADITIEAWMVYTVYAGMMKELKVVNANQVTIKNEMSIFDEENPTGSEVLKHVLKKYLVPAMRAMNEYVRPEMQAMNDYKLLLWDLMVHPFYIIDHHISDFTDQLDIDLSDVVVVTYIEKLVTDDGSKLPVKAIKDRLGRDYENIAEILEGYKELESFRKYYADYIDVPDCEVAFGVEEKLIDETLYLSEQKTLVKWLNKRNNIHKVLEQIREKIMDDSNLDHYSAKMICMLIKTHTANGSLLWNEVDNEYQRLKSEFSIYTGEEMKTFLY